MDSVWYYVRSGVQAGPVSFEALRGVATAGQLVPTDLVWQEGTADWIPARTVPGLFSGQPPPMSAADGPAPPAWAPPPGDYPTVPSRASEILTLVGVFFRRASVPNPATIKPSPAEEEALTKAGVTDQTARKYAAWRRSMLWVSVLPTGFAALLELINAMALRKEETAHLSDFGILILYLQALALFALPVCAVLAANEYPRLAASARWVVLGSLVALGVPMVVAFVPSAWVLDSDLPAAQRELKRFEMGLMFYMTLTPTVFSLLPAVSRGCVRVKVFLPQSLVPGWGLVASVPLFVLLTLATFVLLYRFVGNGLLILSLLLWVGAPLLYLTRFRLLTRPVTDPRDLATLVKMQFMVLTTITGGVLLLIIFLFTAKLGELTLLGFNEADSVIRPWSLDLHATWIEFLGRSLFMTVLFADLLMRMALSVWREEKAFAGSEGAARFDETMSGLSAAIEPKRDEAAA